MDSHDELATAKWQRPLLPTVPPEGVHVVEDYYGAGPVGQAAAEMDAEERDRRKAEAEAKTAMCKPFDEADAYATRLIAASNNLLRAVLLAEGFYQHERGPWRRRSWSYVRRERESET